MKNFIFAAMAMVAVSVGLGAMQAANAAAAYGQQQAGVCAPGVTAPAQLGGK